jgi:hypothetical protein
VKRSRQESWALDAVSALVAAPGLRTWLAIVGAALAIGTAGYMLLEGWNLSDALYMTVISVTTAGFREVRTLDEIGRVWTMLVTGFGVVLIFGSVGLLTEYLVTEATSGRRVGRHMTRQVDELRGHFVVRVVSFYTMAGRRLAELAVRPRVVDFLDAALSHGELSFSLEELHARAGGGWTG